MTKKEQAAMQAAIDRAETLAALRWTEAVAPDVSVPPPIMGRVSEGWDFNAYSKVVEHYWSESSAHGRGTAEDAAKRHRHGSQAGRALYSSEELALRAMRHVIEQQAAAELLKIDRRIAEVRARAQGESK